MAKAAHPAPVLPADPDQQAPADCGMTAPSVPEIQHLLTTTVTQQLTPSPDIAFHLAWSDWHRRRLTLTA